MAAAGAIAQDTEETIGKGRNLRHLLACGLAAALLLTGLEPIVEARPVDEGGVEKARTDAEAVLAHVRRGLWQAHGLFTSIRRVWAAGSPKS